jgi:hypothetical protein
VLTAIQQAKKRVFQDLRWSLEPKNPRICVSMCSTRQVGTGRSRKRLGILLTVCVFDYVGWAREKGTLRDALALKRNQSNVKVG